MQTFPKSPAAARRGGGVLGLLIVVAIILFIVVYASPLAPDRNGVTQAQTQIDRTQSIACQMNINTAYNQMMSLQTANEGVQITPRILEKKGLLPRCPEGGEYVMKNNKIYCTRHSPPPPDDTPAATAATAATTSTQAAATPAAQ